MLNYKDYLFVGIQILLFIAYVFPVDVMYIDLFLWFRFIGMGITILGALLGVVALFQINKRLSPFPTPVSNSKLITNGAFSIARHPIYTAILLVTFGYAFYQESLYKLFIFLLLFLLFNFKSKYEEQLLGEMFSEYKEYKKKTRRFL